MSLIDWLSQKPAAKAPATAAAAAPANAPASIPPSVAAPDSRPPGGRRAERSERREQLYAVVRHAMSSAGVLSASYKFKVLSLDSRGTSFLVMMDMVSQASEDPSRMSEIESLIAHNAKNRFDIVVAAVYWRLSDYVAAGLSSRQAMPAKGAPVAQAAPSAVSSGATEAGVQPAALQPPVRPVRKPEPIGADEVRAFKNAFAAQGKGTPLFSSGEIQKSGQRTVSAPRPELVDGADLEDRVSPLGPTQYGELN